MIFNSIRQRRQWRLFFSKYNILGIKLEHFHMRKYFRETPRIVIHVRVLIDLCIFL